MSQFITLEEAVGKIKNGMTIMVGGFLANGSPNRLLEALAKTDVKDLTLICNDTAFPDRGVGPLIENGQFKKLIVSYIGGTPRASEMMNSGELEVEFVPQGTLAERIRAAGTGLGGFLTPTGLGTIVAEGKEIINVDGKDYLLEKPLRADLALLGASKADVKGNLWYSGTSRNFNPTMAMAADTVIVEPAAMMEAGEVRPEDIHTPGVLVDYIIK